MGSVKVDMKLQVSGNITFDRVHTTAYCTSVEIMHLLYRSQVSENYLSKVTDFNLTPAFGILTGVDLLEFC